MAGTISVTNAVPYSGNYQSFNTSLEAKPTEGTRSMPISATWTTDGVLPNYAIEVNLSAALNVQQFSQIVSLYVDNTSNDADVFFYFSDTLFRLTVPASTVGVYPVVTNSRRFVMYSPLASDGDATFVQILNFQPSPVSAGKTQFTTPVATGLKTLPTNTTPTNTTIYSGAGDIRGLSIYINAAIASVADQLSITLTDGVGGTTLYSVGVLVGIAAADNNLIPMISGLDIPFTNSVNLHLVDVNGHITSGQISVNAYISTK